MELVVNVLAGSIAIVAATWGLLHWHMRPRFIVGVTPSSAEGVPMKQLGRPSVARQFVHEPASFAKRYRDKESLTSRERETLLSDAKRTRVIAVDAASRAQVPVLLANMGKRETDVSMSIHLLPGELHVVRVEAESMQTWVYAHDPIRLEQEDDVKESIRRAYEYLRIPEFGDVIYMSGVLEAGLFELSVLTVEVERRVEDMHLVFAINCSDRWLGAKTYIQGCRLEYESNGAPPPPPG